MMRFHALWLVWTLTLIPEKAINAFLPPHSNGVSHCAKKPITRFSAKPQRLPDNVEGVVYVNDKCINCAACSGFAPQSFQRSAQEKAHIVYHQPETAEEIAEARAALAACPVAAIRVETLVERRHAASDKDAIEASWSSSDQDLVEQMSIRHNKPFPQPFLGDVESVYWLGHHNEASFGAVPYLVQAMHKGESVWIMVDTPKYNKSSIEAVTSLTGPKGPDYLFLTHVDDTADHGKWADEFPSLRRIFHSGDLGRHNWIGDESLEDVEVLLQPQEQRDSDGLAAYDLDGAPIALNEWLTEWLTETTDDNSSSNVVVLHTPGHSPGSISLYRLPTTDTPGILFTGDTYGFTTRDDGHMTGFPQYGNNLQTQAQTLEKLLELDWQVIAAGHGHSRDYRGRDVDAREKEMQVALEEMRTNYKW